MVHYPIPVNRFFEPRKNIASDPINWLDRKHVNTQLLT